MPNKKYSNVNKPWFHSPYKVIALCFVITFGIWGVFSGTFATWLGYLPFSAFSVFREKPEGVTEESELVDLSIKVLHELDRGNPAATPIRVYDANMEFIESSSTSSGIATFAAPYWEGETVYLQARAAAPSSASYVTYTTPLLSYTVPEGDVNGDAELPMLYLWETSTSTADYNITDQTSASIYAEATDFVNTTDTSLNILISITADCAYGTPEAFTDMDTAKHYLAGIWLYVKGTASQAGIINYVAHFYSSSLHFYVFNIPMVVYDSDLGYQTARTIVIGDGSTGFTASADFDFDLFDTCWANSVSDISESSFLNGDSDLNPSALANKVA
jgi:hypothetical protein